MTTAYETPNLKVLTGWADGEDFWGTPMNANLVLLDALVNLFVRSRTLTAPPGVLAAGDRYIIPTGATDVWAGQVGKIAYFTGTGWLFITPAQGWRAAVAGGEFVYYDGSAWVAEPASGGSTGVDIRLTALETLTAAHTASLVPIPGQITAINEQITAQGLQISGALTALDGLKLISPLALMESRPLAGTDNMKYLDAAAGGAVTVIIPTTAEKPIPIGFHCLVFHNPATERLSFAKSVGVTVEGPPGIALESAGKGSTIALYKRAAEVWHISGNLRIQSELGTGERMAYTAASGTPLSVTVGRDTRRAIIQGDSPPTVTITLPEAVDGQTHIITTVPALSTLVWAAAGGKAVFGPASLPSHGRIGMQYYEPGNRWVPF